MADKTTYEDSGFDSLLGKVKSKVVDETEFVTSGKIKQLSGDVISSGKSTSANKKMKINWNRPEIVFSNLARDRISIGDLDGTGIYGIRVIDQAGNTRFESSDERQFIDMASRQVTVSTEKSGDYNDIQKAVDYINGLGGGIVFIKAGTYTLTSNIRLYANIHLVGEARDTTIIDFNSGNYRIYAEGDTSEYRTGTVTCSNGSAVLTGSGTAWLSNVIDTDSIMLDGILYGITSVNSDTTMTISQIYQGAGVSSVSYACANFISNISVQNLTIKNSSGNTPTGILEFSYVSDLKIRDVFVDNFVSGTYADGIHLKRCIDSTILNAEVSRCQGNGIESDSGQNIIIDNCHVHNNDTNADGNAGILLNNSLSLGTKNIIRECYIGNNGYNGISIASGKNLIQNNIIFRSRYEGILIANTENVVMGNIIEQSGTYGLDLYNASATYNTIVGNYISFNASGAILINHLSAANNLIVGNNLRQQTDTTYAIYNTSGQTATNYIDANTGMTFTSNRKFVLATNTSGGTLNQGDIVVIDPVAGNFTQVTTTTSAGNNLVFGMVNETILVDEIGEVQTLGYTTMLKVDGTTNIAVGDFLSTFTTAKICKKASAGETAIAIALEAYTTDDSNGVLNALIIPPRYI